MKNAATSALKSKYIIMLTEPCRLPVWTAAGSQTNCGMQQQRSVIVRTCRGALAHSSHADGQLVKVARATATRRVRSTGHANNGGHHGNKGEHSLHG